MIYDASEWIFRYYGDSDEDRLELGRAIYQIEQMLHKCIELRKRKELEISLLQQPIRNWSGDSIEKLGTMRLMTQVSNTYHGPWIMIHGRFFLAQYFSKKIDCNNVSKFKAMVRSILNKQTIMIPVY